MRKTRPDPTMADRSLLYSDILRRPESLSSYLPYDEYLSESKIFVMKDGSLGAVMEVGLLAHEPMTEIQILRVTKEINSWFRLPDNYSAQILYESSYIPPNASDISSLKKEVDAGHPVSAMLFKEKLRAIEDSCAKPSDDTPLKRSLLLSIRYFPDHLDGKNVADIKAVGSSFKDDLNSFVYYLRNLVEGSSISLKQLDLDDLALNIRRFFNPQSFYERSFAKVNPSISLSQQLLYSAAKVDHQGITREGIMTRTLTLKCPPSFSYPGGMAQFVDLKFPFKIGINLSFPLPSKVKKFLAIKEFLLENAVSAKARIQKQEVESVQESLARDDKCLQMTFCIIVEGKHQDELQDRCRQLKQVFTNQLDCELIEEEHIGLGLCLNTLPLNYTPDSDHSTQRGIRILRSDLSSFIPIYDSTQKLGNATNIYLSRENSLVPFSLLGNETSNHSVVLADTGAGKSAFVIDCVLAAKRLDPEPIVFVIDKKSSYGMVSRYFDADITVFERDKEIPFSPFRGNYNDEKIAFLTRMILTAVKLTSPSFVAESEHQVAVTEAIKGAYLKKREQNRLTFEDGAFVESESNQNVCIGMSDVVAALGLLTGKVSSHEASLIRELAVKLKPFYGDGIYAQFFKEGAEETRREDCLFYVYDLDALDGDPVLQALMTMAVTEEIRNILSLPQNQGRSGFLVMEEFAMLGRNNPAFKDFAIDFAETMRKRGCWLITLTPRPQNYFDLEVGQAFWGVADNFIFLQMSPDNVDYITTKSSLFDEANTEIIRSLRTKRGKYADVFYMDKGKSRQGAFRFRQTKYDRWMSPTNAKDASRALAALERFPNRWDALEYLASQHP